MWGGGDGGSHVGVRGEMAQETALTEPPTSKQARNIAIKTLAVSQKNRDLFFFFSFTKVEFV